MDVPFPVRYSLSSWPSFSTIPAASGNCVVWRPSSRRVGSPRRHPSASPATPRSSPYSPLCHPLKRAPDPDCPPTIRTPQTKMMTCPQQNARRTKRGTSPFTDHMLMTLTCHILLVLLSFSEPHNGLFLVLSEATRRGYGLRGVPSDSLAAALLLPRPNSSSSFGHDLSLESDVNSVGLFPSSFVKVIVPGLHTLGTATPGFKTLTAAHVGARGSSFGFHQVGPYLRVPDWGVLGARHQKSPPLLSPNPTEVFAISDYILAAPRSSYVLDRENCPSICGPAWSNDNFDLFNCFFAYNPSSTIPRMELITKGFMKGGPSGADHYEVFTNNDVPRRPPAYWIAQRWDRLSEKARAQCLAYYPLPR
jgi:hypothetical protein